MDSATKNARRPVQASPRKYTPAVQKARRQLKEKGWTYRAAAPELGVTYQHLAAVLTAVRISSSLLERIDALPSREFIK